MIFDKFKKLHELKKMQDEFKKEKITVSKQEVSVTVNGNFEVEVIKLNPNLNIEDQQNILKQCLNEAKQKIQQTLAQKMMSSGMGLGL